MPNADIDIETRSELYLKLIERQKPAVWGFCLRRAHYNVERAQDMVQEVWMALWKYFGSLRPDCTEEQERKWVLLRARGILCSVELDKSPPLVLVDNLPETAAVETEERDERLLLLFNRLDADDRQLMQMHLDGYSFDEIGSALGISAMAVRMRKSRIIRYLQRMAKKMENDRKNKQI